MYWIVQLGGWINMIGRLVPHRRRVRPRRSVVFDNCMEQRVLALG